MLLWPIVINVILEFYTRVVFVKLKQLTGKLGSEFYFCMSTCETNPLYHYDIWTAERGNNFFLKWIPTAKTTIPLTKTGMVNAGPSIKKNFVQYIWFPVVP
jgi:hypothetical protein